MEDNDNNKDSFDPDTSNSRYVLTYNEMNFKPKVRYK
jgi:hypothetical protein